jgi:DNA ligase-1
MPTGSGSMTISPTVIGSTIAQTVEVPLNNTNKPFRPLLAATIENDEQLATLKYPMIMSPKVDGIRVLCHPELGPVTRSLKPVRNTYVHNILSNPIFHGLDGEVTVGRISAPNVFNATTVIMGEHGEPDFTYWVFDNFTYAGGYQDRLQKVKDNHNTHFHVCLLHETEVCEPSGVLSLEQLWLAAGFEGIMLRSLQGPYKHGRSTLREQTLLKLKRFKDAEATIIGFEPLYQNQNTQTRSALGLAERSSHKDGLRTLETLGSLRVRCTNPQEQAWEFSIGSGFDQAQRSEIWDKRDELLGRQVSFKYQECGTKEAPRFPIFKGFRPQE